MKDIRHSTPRAYYNEIDTFCAHWLYNLVQAKLIAPGDIDTRDIRDVRPSDLKDYTQCHFFAGIGGWSYALRLAGVPDRYPIWTGSCPCQPFSAAGRRKGFADERHLWPYWHWLIAQRRPAVVFGEQVASASEWLGLVRGNLEALDYAVGAMPVEAASAGADHLRDRYWFVAHAAQQQRNGSRGTGSVRPTEYEIQRGRTTSACASRASDNLAHTDQPERRIGDEQRAGQLAQQQQHPETRNGFDVGDTGSAGTGRHSSSSTRTQTESQRKRQFDGSGRDAPLASSGDFDWAIGTDGKARRVKRGIRLLAHAVFGRLVVRRTVVKGDAEIQEENWYNRIGALKGFGNAIDPVCAKEFILASLEALGDVCA